VKALQTPDIHHARAAQGWLELGNHLEANEELEKISPEKRAHPDVLEIRWQIYSKESIWDACRNIAAAITKSDPGRLSGWVNLAYATRRAAGGRIAKAQEILLEAIQWFPKESVIPYNLACYACQSDDLKGAWQWLEHAFELGDAAELKLKALEDPDLEKLWSEISET